VEGAKAKGEVVNALVKEAVAVRRASENFMVVNK
jgi:hypothetical protein